MFNTPFHFVARIQAQHSITISQIQQQTLKPNNFVHFVSPRTHHHGQADHEANNTKQHPIAKWMSAIDCN